MSEATGGSDELSYWGRRRGLWSALAAISLLISMGLAATADDVDDDATIRVLATGQKNPNSAGTEVCILSTTVNGQEAPADQWQLEQGWSRQQGLLGDIIIAAGDRVSTATLTVPSDATVRIRAVKREWSGRAQFERGTDVKEVDLYADRWGGGLVTFEGNAERRIRWCVAALVCVAIVVVGITAKRRLGREPQPSEYVLFVAPLLASSLLMLAAFFPAIMTNDSVLQWSMAHSASPLEDAHPYGHTLLVWLLTRLVDSPAFVAIVQASLLAIAVAYLIYSTRLLGAPLLLAFVVALVIAVLPPNLSLPITLWKDIPYTAAMLFLVAALLRLSLRNGSTDQPVKDSVLIFAVALLAIVCRHQGVIVVVPSLLLAAVAFPPARKRLVVVALSVIALWLVYRGPLFRRLNVVSDEKSSIAYGFLGAHVAAGTPMDESELALLAKVRPLEKNWGYDCVMATSSIMWDGRLNVEEAIKHRAELERLALSLAWRDPTVELRHIACGSSYIWRVTPSPHFVIGPFAPPSGSTFHTILPNEFVKEQPLSAELNSWANHAMWWSFNDPSVDWLFWRPAIYVYPLFAAFLLYAAVARSARICVAAAPLVIDTLVLVVASPSPDFRYMYPVYLCAISLAPAFLWISVNEAWSPRAAA